MAYYGLRQPDRARSTLRVFSRGEVFTGVVPVGSTDTGETLQVLGAGVSKPGCLSSLGGGYCLFGHLGGSPFAALLALADFDRLVSHPLSPSLLLHL